MDDTKPLLMFIHCVCVCVLCWVGLSDGFYVLSSPMEAFLFSLEILKPSDDAPSSLLFHCVCVCVYVHVCHCTSVCIVRPHCRKRWSSCVRAYLNYPTKLEGD